MLQIGAAGAAYLRADGFEPEMVCGPNVLAMTSPCDDADALERLAKALPDPGSQAITSGEELGELLCARCANRELCWGKGRVRTERLLADMMDRVERGEAVDEDNLPALAEHGCLRAESIEEAAQEALAALKRREAGIRKARYERELTLTHLAALSGTLGELSMMAGGESLNDLKAAHILNLALEELNVPARLSYARRVDGHLQAALETDGMMPVQKPLEMLLRYLATEEDLPLSITRAARGRVELEEIPLYSASVGMASVCAGERGEGDGVCGDACSAKRCEGGRLLLMLLDGMGHGEEAHRQSEKTLELLTLLLEAGYTRRQAITAVNGIMLSIQEEERFSTVDLADVDLWTGQRIFGKAGRVCLVGGAGQPYEKGGRRIPAAGNRGGSGGYLHAVPPAQRRYSHYGQRRCGRRL